MDLAIDFRHQGGHFSDKKYPHELLGELPKVGVVVGWLLKPELCVSPTIVGEIVTGGWMPRQGQWVTRPSRCGQVLINGRWKMTRSHFKAKVFKE